MRARVLVSVAVAATIALGATGCEFMAPQDTREIKQISDGVNTSTGSVDVRNAIFVSKNGKHARFIGTLINSADSKRTLTIETKNGSEDVSVPANSTLNLSSNDTDTTVVFHKLGAKPGSLARTSFSVSGSETSTARVPVLSGSMDDYATLVPTPSQSPTSTATSTATATAAAAKH